MHLVSASILCRSAYDGYLSLACSVSVPWKILSDMGHQVRFATSDGRPSRGCDPVLLEGIWGGLVMKASDEVQQFYEEMKHNPAYLSPDAYSEVEAKHFDGIFFVDGFLLYCSANTCFVSRNYVRWRPRSRDERVPGTPRSVPGKTTV